MSSDENDTHDPSVEGILLGGLTLSLVSTEGGTHVEIDESKATNMSPLELLGLLELAKVSIYDDVMGAQFIPEEYDIEEGDGPDG